MTRKTRIIISLLFVVIAFAAGIAAYAGVNRDRDAKAGGGTTTRYSVDADGKIALPAINTSAAKGTEENPLIILEIVPYEGLGTIGYHIAGCEPINMEKVKWNGEYDSLPAEGKLFTVTRPTVTFWEKDAPEGFTKYKVEGKYTVTELTQYGAMKYVSDNTGDYKMTGAPTEVYEPAPDGYTGTKYKEVTKEDGSKTYEEDTNGTFMRRIKATFAEVPEKNGDYVWEPLSVEDCQTLATHEKRDERLPYLTGDHVEGSDVRTCLENVKYISVPHVETIEHNNIFLKESIGLAYEMEDGKRVNYKEEAGKPTLEERIANYKCIVYTVTPEDLNITKGGVLVNQALIDCADLICISSTDSTGAAINTYKKFKEDGGSGLKCDLNKETTDCFQNNPLDWPAALAIYKRASNTEHPVPIIWDTKTFTNFVKAENLKKDVVLQCKDASGSFLVNSKVDGSDDNMYKLYLLLYEMSASVLQSFFGDPASFPTASVEKTITLDGGGTKTLTMTTPLLTDYIGEEAQKYWASQTLYPWKSGLLPHKTSMDDASNVAVLDTFGIMNSGADGVSIFHYNSSGAQNLVRNGIHIYDGDKFMGTDFNNPSQVKNDQYGQDVYEFFESVGLTKTQVTTAEILYYLLNGLTNSPSVPNNYSYRVLELQPATKFKTASAPGTATDDAFWRAFIAKYANTTGTVTVDRMSVPEFIGKHVELISEYDLIYIGVNVLPGNWTMDFSGTDFIYAHTGPTVTISGKSALRGWLADSSHDVTTYTLSGNDLTKLALTKLQQYVASGAPLLFGTGFFTNETATSVASNIDHNSYMYQLYAGSAEFSGISNPIYEYALSKKDTYMATEEALRKGLAKSRRVELEVTSKPKEYSGVTEHSDHNKSEHYLTNNTLSFTFKVNAPTGTSYELALYVDANGDGTFSTNERLDNLTVYSNGTKITNGILEAGKSYNVSREVTDRVGAVAWKLDLVANTPSVEVEDRMVYTSLQGLSAIKATTKDTLNILQIVKDSDNVLLLPQDSEGNAGGLMGVQKKFWDWTRNINGLDIHFTRMTQAEVLQKLTENVKYLNTYNMLILGFGDCYNAASDDALLDAIEAFIATGKAVLYTHDASSTVGDDGASADDKSWAKEITWRFRDRFGMDRYDVSTYRGLTGKTRADYPFLPSSTVSTDMVIASTSSNEVEYMFSALTSEGYGYTATPSGDAVNVSFNDQYQEIQYTLPTAVNKNDCEKIVIKYATASNASTKDIAIKLKNEANEDIHTKYNLISTTVTEYEVNASELTGNKVSKVCFMANSEACSATVYSVTFIMKPSVGSPTTHLLVQGFTNGHLYRHAMSLPHNQFAKRVSKQNSGAITQYPYEIPDSFEIAKTHTQYYQLDMEQKEMNVWFCLADGTEVNNIDEVKGKTDYQNKLHSYYSSTANDGRNNYYIYNFGNITYSGMGHDGNMTDTEIKLFINTFVAAYRATATPVKVVAVNPDATKNATSGEYYLCVDVDSKDGEKLLGGTAQGIYEKYTLQEWNGTEYVVSDTPTGTSKRVYFYLDDKTSGGGKREYTLKCSIDSFGTELEVKPLAIYRTDDMGTDTSTTHMSLKDNSKKFKSSSSEIYYVDVPIKKETVGAKKAVTTTNLNIKVIAKYTIGSEEYTTEGDTKIIITPRGLFDLD
ncbi:MAG: DUF5057 domain-containing protein [Lachnospiraceae bacterium]|nr:DUF5057 domain-containing protein [Lachnospiraceae bacterium]